MTPSACRSCSGTRRRRPRRGGIEVVRLDHEQSQPVGRDLAVAALVVAAPLLTAVDAAHGHDRGLVEVCVGLVVLALAVLDHQPVSWVVGVHRELPVRAVLAGVAEQPLEGVLTRAALFEELVAEVEDVGGAALGSVAHMVRPVE